MQERKAKKKVLLSCTLMMITVVASTKHFIWSTIEVLQARISEIQEALQETKAVQEMKEQVHHLFFISCKHM